ncbi:MAG: hypothetical protein WAT39_00125 [Planctomycetota bacterium]
MTLPNEEVMDLLRTRFVVGTRNIEREGHVGMSHGYGPTQTAVGTTNGAGGRNVQLVVLSADETVVHALPGFWHPEDLLVELRLALELHKLHGDDEMPTASKLAMFQALHRSHLRRHGEAMESRSGWQGFDANHELMRAKTERRDTVLATAKGDTLKSIPQIVHERLLARPFQKLAAFGMEAFVDYGRPYYDNNAGLDKGKNFPRAEQSNKKRDRQQQKERAAPAAPAGEQDKR